jgi:hypothetical protein
MTSYPEQKMSNYVERVETPSLIKLKAILKAKLDSGEWTLEQYNKEYSRYLPTKEQQDWLDHKLYCDFYALPYQ